jgi:ketosteroid isomerase-like protein
MEKIKQGILVYGLASLIHWTAMTNPIEVVLQFERLINAGNAEGICSLMASDGEFIDSLGNRIQGTEKLRAAWIGYFKIVPDYSISHSEVFADGNTVAIFGSAQGTFSKDGKLPRENFWKTPAAWRAVIKNGKIAIWQVYADNEPIRAIMRKAP